MVQYGSNKQEEPPSKPFTKAINLFHVTQSKLITLKGRFVWFLARNRIILIPQCPRSNTGAQALSPNEPCRKGMSNGEGRGPEDKPETAAVTFPQSHHGTEECDPFRDVPEAQTRTEPLEIHKKSSPVLGSTVCHMEGSEMEFNVGFCCHWRCFFKKLPLAPGEGRLLHTCECMHRSLLKQHAEPGQRLPGGEGRGWDGGELPCSVATFVLSVLG